MICLKGVGLLWFIRGMRPFKVSDMPIQHQNWRGKTYKEYVNPASAAKAEMLFRQAFRRLLHQYSA